MQMRNFQSCGSIRCVVAGSKSSELTSCVEKQRSAAGVPACTYYYAYLIITAGNI